MKRQILVLLACSLLFGCSGGNESAPEEDKENVTPQVGEKLSKNYSIFKVVEANEKWTKYRVCSASDCSCEGNYFVYFVTCKNGTDEILAVWGKCNH